MSFSEDLLGQALALLVRADTPDGLGDVDLRRVVSASYYSVFHCINADAANLLAPHVSVETNHRIQRWFDHSEMKRVCERFLPSELGQPLRGLIGHTSSSHLRIVALGFIELQEARHGADYDLGFEVTEQVAWDVFDKANEVIDAWNKLSGSAEANIFILSLLLWKNWEKIR